MLTNLVHDLFVVVELVRTDAGSALEHRGHVVVPLKPSLRVIPIDGPVCNVSAPSSRRRNVRNSNLPTKVCWIDVWSEAILKAMQLIGADKVHLASESGLVSFPPEVVGVGWDVGIQVRSIVVGSDFRWELATDQAESTWSA